MWPWLLLSFLQCNAKITYRSDGTSIEVGTSDGYKIASEFLANSLNLSVDPCNDFFDFVCTKWISRHPINGSECSTSVGEKIHDKVLEKMKGIFESEDSSDSKSMKDLKVMYRKCMDIEEIDRTGIKQLINSIKSYGTWPMLEGDHLWHDEEFDFTSLLAHVSKIREEPVFFATYLLEDGEKTFGKIVEVSQGRLGMGDSARDYYLNEDFSEKLSAYRNFLIKKVMLFQKHVGIPTNKTKTAIDVDEIIELEKNISKILVPDELRRNYTSIRGRLNNLQELFPLINWTTYFQSSAPIAVHDYFASNPEVQVMDKRFFKSLTDLLQSADPRIITNNVFVQYGDLFRTELGEEYDDILQEFMNVMYGAKEKPEKWKRCALNVIDTMTLAAGAMYVKKDFDQASKNLSSEIVEEIRAAFLNLTKSNDWMDEETRARALDKAKFMGKHVAYPDFILNNTKLDSYYGRLNIEESDSYSQMISKTLRWSIERNYGQLVKPTNHTDIEFDSPAVVDAFYYREANFIEFSAGMLQPPFFHPTFPRALNYAGIGAVIGHELIHGFDDVGRKFDENGKICDWWSEETEKQYEKRKQCFVDQYNRIKVRGTNLTVSGSRTQGENIADNGGLKLALKAYKHYLQEHGEENRIKGLEEYNDEQTFFIGYASVHCGHSTTEKLTYDILTDPHAPQRHRVNQVLANQPEFAAAFSCSVDTALNPKERCILW